MAITNGYCTLEEAKARLTEKRTYTTITVSFTITSNIIADTAYGLGFLEVGDAFTLTGSTSNDGTYTVASVTSAAAIVTTEALATEAAGDTVVITQIYSKASAVNSDHDPIIEDIVEAASRWIDKMTQRQWYTDSETRYYVVGQDTDGAVLYLDKPLQTVTTLTNGDSEVLTVSTEYILEPINGSSYSEVRLLDSGGKAWTYSTDIRKDTISIAGTWGYAAAVTANIKEACLLLTARLWKRKDAVFGVAGTSALGTQTMRIPIDPDVMALLPRKTPWGLNY